MRVNVVTVTSGWILQKLAERMVNAANEMGHNFTLSNQAENNFDCNFYVDVQNCYHGKSKTKDIGLFTHVHADDMTTVDPRTFSLDHIVHMCTRYYELFAPTFPKEKMSVLFPGEFTNTFQMYKPKIGIFQRGKYEGKGFHFMLNLASDPIMKSFRFKFVGQDWEEVVHKMATAGLEIEYHRSENHKQYNQHYHDIDYLLIPSLWEGGPMSLLEGLAVGKPIISSDVGWVGDFPVDFLYKPNDTAGLVKIFNKILEPMEKKRALADSVNYKNYIENLMIIIKGVTR